jgi:SAM-dependent methyltransferase
MTALAAYEAGLRIGGGCWVSWRGSRLPLPLQRWLADADASDQALIDRCTGPTLDVGCGPGRLVAALAARGRVALGIDVSPEAVRLGTARGAAVVRRDVFGPVPSAGRWAHVLLADGNVGIGGDVVALLRRCAELLRPGGTVVVEVERPGAGHVVQLLDLVGPGGHRGRLRWARVGADAVAALAAAAGLALLALDSTCGRHVAVLGSARP